MEGATPPAAPAGNPSPTDSAHADQAPPPPPQQQQQPRHGIGGVVLQQERHTALEEYAVATTMSAVAGFGYGLLIGNVRKLDVLRAAKGYGLNGLLLGGSFFGIQKALSFMFSGGEAESVLDGPKWIVPASGFLTGSLLTTLYAGPKAGVLGGLISGVLASMGLFTYGMFDMWKETQREQLQREVDEQHWRGAEAAPASLLHHPQHGKVSGGRFEDESGAAAAAGAGGGGGIRRRGGGGDAGAGSKSGFSLPEWLPIKVDEPSHMRRPREVEEEEEEGHRNNDGEA